MMEMRLLISKTLSSHYTIFSATIIVRLPEMEIISTWQTKSCYVCKNYLYFDLNVVYVFKKVSLLPSANGATRSEKGLFLKWICRISNTYPNFLV
jgi:hypothetical protein